MDEYEHKKLSEKELICLKLLISGYHHKEIALRMNIGKNTVKSYIARLKYKLDSKTTAQMIAKAYNNKIIIS